MKLRYFFLLFFLGVIAFPGMALDIVKHDSSDNVLEPNNSRTKFIFAFDARNAFALGHKVKMSGLKIGFEILDVHRMGLGFYSNRNPIVVRNLNEFNHKVVVNFGYTALYYERVIYEKGKWEFTIPVFLGGGEAELQILNDDDSEIIDPVTEENYSQIRKVKLPMGGFSITGQYKITRLIGIGSGLGYRFVMSRESQATKSFNSPFYIIKLKIFIGELFKKKDKSKKNKTPSEPKE